MIFNDLKGRVIFLNASFPTIVDRLANDDSRPLFNKSEEIYHFRKPLYLEYADLVIEVDGKSVEEIAEEIVKRGGEYGE